MKSKVIIIFSVIIFIFTIVVPASNFIMNRSKKKTGVDRSIKLEEEIEEVRKMSSSHALSIETFDPASEYDSRFVANRKAFIKQREEVKNFYEFSNKYSRAISGPAAKMLAKAEKLTMNCEFDKAAELLAMALKQEPANNIIKLKIYQQLAMIFVIKKNDKNYLKSLLRYVEVCEGMDFDAQTKIEITKVKNDLKQQIASAK